jgi:hypothetical protein
MDSDFDEFFELGTAAARREKIRAGLPTTAPAGFATVTAGIDALPEAWLLTPDEMAGSLAAAQTAINRLVAYQHAVAAAADTTKASRTLRAGTTGMLVAVATGRTPAAGSAIVNTARTLAHLPATAAAFTAGAISAEHAGQIAAHAGRVPEIAAAEDQFAAMAARTDPHQTRHRLHVFEDAYQPACPDLDTAAQHARRGLDVSHRPNGTIRVTGILPETDGIRLMDVLAGFTDPPDADDPRTPTQRRADAFADLVAAAAANTRPLGVNGLSVLVDLDHLPHGATLADGTPLTAAMVDYTTCAAAITIIFGTRHGDRFAPLALARTRRLASPAQWDALIARDRGCLRCGRAPRYCQAHHIIGWASGGPTDLDNLCLLCSRCHHDLHHGAYTIYHNHHGLPTITPTRAPPAAV